MRGMVGSSGDELAWRWPHVVTANAADDDEVGDMGLGDKDDEALDDDDIDFDDDLEDDDLDDELDDELEDDELEDELEDDLDDELDAELDDDLIDLDDEYDNIDEEERPLPGPRKYDD